MKQGDQKGFSLIEVIVAMGLMAIVSMGVMHINQQLSSSTNYIESKLEELDQMNNLRLRLINKAACTKSFGGNCTLPEFFSKSECELATGTWTDGLILNPSNSVTEVTTIYNKKGLAILSKDQEINRTLKVTKITLQNEPEDQGGVALDGGQGSVKVKISFERLKKILGPSTVEHFVNIMVKTNAALPAKIENCISASDAEVIPKDRTYLVTKKNDPVCGGCPYGVSPCDAGVCGSQAPNVDYTSGDNCGANCIKYMASCKPGDQALAGDCIVNAGNAANVFGDLYLSIPSAANCSGCPGTPCDDICNQADYSGYECIFYATSHTPGQSGARILCLDRSF